ncbi:MAG: SDR family oxidoreductase [Parvularculaceae bacterium]|nr:SDR family oxidoreductase [Parvularculaceae bacterium]
MARFVIIGTSGLGGTLARTLAGQGHSLHLISRGADALSELGRELGASFAAADVTDALALDAAILAAGAPLDGLAYCVGSINLKPAHRVSDSDALSDFEINALGALRAVRSALPALRASAQTTASVLLFSTVAVAQGFANHASIAMAKGAVEGLTRALAAELAPKIRVNAIAPSLTRTPLAASMTSNEATAKAIAALHPLQRLGEISDIAPLAALLLSPASDWITGQVIGVDGGRSSLRTRG